MAAAIDGGSFGFVLLDPAGNPLASLNAEDTYYPASSIKILHHLHAIRWVGAEPDPAAALEAPVAVYDQSCSGTGTYRTESLDSVLRAMMIASDNRRTNAVQDHFGREEILATARLLGVSDHTLLAHRFGCGGPANDPANRMTAADLALVYHRIGDGTALTPEGRSLLESRMLGLDTGILDTTIERVAESGQTPREEAASFADGLRLSFKEGWWETSLTIGGLLTVPREGCPDRSADAFAFAVFVDGAARIDGEFSMRETAALLLEDVLRDALAEYPG